MSNNKDISSLFDRSGNLTPDAMQRFIDGLLGADELKAVEAHLENSPFDREALEGLRKHPTLDLQQELTGLNDRISRTAKEKAGKPVRSITQRYYWAVAAGLAGIIALAILLVFMFRSPVNNQLAVTIPFSPASDSLVVLEPPARIMMNPPPKTEYHAVESNAIAEEKLTNVDKVIRQDEIIVQNPEPVIRNPEAEIPVVAQAGENPDSGFVEANEQIIVSEMVAPPSVMPQKALGYSSVEAEPFLVVEQMPEFPGGVDSLNKYIKSNLHYPDSAKIQGIQGTVYVRFIVSKTGKISGVSLLRGIGGGCDEEAMRIVKQMPDWTPGKQNGIEIPVYYTLPVKFSLK